MITETGVFPPPIVILKSHDAKLEEHDNVIHDIIHKLDYLHSQIEHSPPTGVNEGTNKREMGTDVAAASATADADADADADEEPEQELLMEVVMRDLTNSREFIEGIVDKIVNDTNMSDVIMKIEPLVKENQELRSLIHSQQQMMNEMNTMLLRLLNTNGAMSSSPASSSPEPDEPIVFQDNGLDGDGLYQPEMTEIVLSNLEPVDEESEVTVDPDTEPGQIIDIESDADAEAPEAEAEAPEAEAEAPEAEAEAPEAEAEAPEADAESTELSEMPHFPISLIVSEI
jgi:hypothetical protein